MGKGVDIPWVGVKIPWVWGSVYMYTMGHKISKFQKKSIINFQNSLVQNFKKESKLK